MVCTKCNNELTLTEGEYADYLYCNICFYYTWRSLDTCCRNSNMQYVTLGKQLREQCFNCGSMRGGALSYSLVADVNKIPVHNQPLRDSFYERSGEERKEFAEKINTLRKETFNEQYSDYLSSDNWRKLRLKILERDKYICQGCLRNRANQVHHKTYERLYDECCFDLISVCEDCHKKIHNR